MERVEFVKSDGCDWDDHFFPAIKKTTPGNNYEDFYYRVSEADSVINRLTAAASNLLKKHKLGAVTEADERWMETELAALK